MVRAGVDGPIRHPHPRVAAYVPGRAVEKVALTLGPSTGIASSPGVNGRELERRRKRFTLSGYRTCVMRRRGNSG